jgi:ribonuclease VapC
VIVIDTSAILAVVLKEPEGPDFLAAMLTADDCLLSSANLLEARMVLHARDPANIPDLDAFLKRIGVQIEPVTESHSDLAFAAFCRFGKGTGHPAGLNFGDCFAYALARDQGCALLFKGNDFSRTNVKPVI